VLFFIDIDTLQKECYDMKEAYDRYAEIAEKLANTGER
jgi:hypothetical protein